MLHFLFIQDNFSDNSDQIGQKSQKPEESASFGKWLWILLNDLDFGQNIEVVINPVNTEESPGQNCKNIGKVELWGFLDQLLDFLVLVDCFKQPEKFSCVSHGAYKLLLYILKRASSFFEVFLSPFCS